MPKSYRCLSVVSQVIPLVLRLIGIDRFDAPNSPPKNATANSPNKDRKARNDRLRIMFLTVEAMTVFEHVFPKRPCEGGISPQLLI